MGIKFRAFNGESMEYGGFSVHATDGKIVPSHFTKVSEHSPLMQSTGVKDINDKEIFVGDVLWCEHANCKGDVWFDDGQFTTDAFGECRGIRNGDPLEVIGNIYENPEMWEGIVRL